MTCIVFLVTNSSSLLACPQAKESKVTSGKSLLPTYSPLPRPCHVLWTVKFPLVAFPFSDKICEADFLALNLLSSLGVAGVTVGFNSHILPDMS